MNRIRELREDRDLRQIDVAKATNIDQKTLSNYETGKTNPDSAAIVKLAEFFGVTCDYLLGVSARNMRNIDMALQELDSIICSAEEIKKIFEKKLTYILCKLRRPRDGVAFYCHMSMRFILEK